MKIKEAKAIINKMLQWQFILMGTSKIEETVFDESIDLKNYSLSELINANKKVDSSNKIKATISERNVKKGKDPKGIEHHMTIDEGIIAAVYCCLHFPKNNELVAVFEDAGVAVVHVKYDKNKKP